MKFEFTKQEVGNILACIDVAIRQGGTQAAQGLLPLAQKIHTMAGTEAEVVEEEKEIPVEETESNK